MRVLLLTAQIMLSWLLLGGPPCGWKSSNILPMYCCSFSWLMRSSSSWEAERRERCDANLVTFFPTFLEIFETFLSFEVRDFLEDLSLLLLE